MRPEGALSWLIYILAAILVVVFLIWLIGHFL